MELAKRLRFLRNEIIAEELIEAGKGFIGLYEAFKEYLKKIHLESRNNRGLQRVLANSRFGLNI
jgi:hypothetical protein